MSETMQRDLFEKELAKIINIILSMYSREKNHLPITQGLSNTLTAAVLDGSRVLDPMLQVLLSNLHKMVVTSPDFSASNPNAMKNFNELLRCFEIIGNPSDPSLPPFMSSNRCNNLYVDSAFFR